MLDFHKISWEEFKKISLEKKVLYFNRDNNIFDVLFSQQFDRVLLDQLYNLTNTIRKLSKSEEGRHFLANLLPHHRAMLYFVQPSTRTFLSFASACQILGMHVSDVRSVETSSEVKGESFVDTIRTISSFFDLVVMRYPEPGYAELAAFELNRTNRPIPVINAGSGKDQHPTQALLDIYTLRRSFEEIDHGDLKNKTIMMVGDLKRGRTVRSLSQLLTNFKDIRIIFSSPPEFAIEKDIVNFLEKNNISVLETHDFEKHLPEADAIYMTRVQNEYKTENISDDKLNIEQFALTPQNLHLLKKNAVILHPLPRRHEISLEIDQDPRAVYWRQVRNGMWTRTALLATVLNVADKINQFQL